jgi:uncharacterized protein
MDSSADPAAEFADRPWMDPETDPLESSATEEKKAPKATWNQARAWESATHALPLLGWLIPGGVNLLVPILIWQLKAKKEGNEALAEQAIESLNFQINLAAISVVLSITLVGLVLIPVLWIAAAVFMIIASVKAYQGKSYRYPWIYRVFS